MCTSTSAGTLGVDAVEERAELDRAKPPVRLSDNRTGLDVERRKQRGGTVPSVVVRAPFGLPGLHRQQRGGAVEGLNLGLLVDAQHHGVLGRIDIQPDDVSDFVDQLPGQATA